MNKKVATVGSAVRRAIDDIAHDNRSGAAEILRRAADVFRLLASSEKELDDDDARNLIKASSVALIRAQPRMAALANLADSVARETSHATDVLNFAAATACRFIDEVEQAVQTATESAARLIREGSVVLTHSRSSTVLAALMKAREAGRDFAVIATESRPKLEGRQLAAELAARGVSVTLVADAAAACEVGRADLVLVGADMITPDSLVNKIGTRMIALAAREATLAAYALSDGSKIINAGPVSDADGDLHNAAELWADPPAGVDIRNRYFETTPLNYFTKIITEDGPLDPADVRRRAESKRLAPSLVDALKR